MGGDGLRLDCQAIECTPAKMLCVQADGTVYMGRRRQMYKSGDDGRTWNLVGWLPATCVGHLATVSRLAGRLLRQEIRALAILSSGSCVASSRSGVFYGKGDGERMEPSEVEGREKGWSPPMTMTVGPSEVVLWGEYNSKFKHGLPIRVYASDDKGRSYHVVRVFEAGSILHIHNIVFDQAAGHYWVFTGDFDDEAGIGRLSADFKDFEWAARGKQCFRVVEAFDFGDHLVYGTDSGYEKNEIVRWHKSSGRVERLAELEGSCIYACRFGRWYALTTTVEPSVVNRSQCASLWVSRDGEKWAKVLSAKKDRWHPVYFQFGSIVLPRGASDKETLLFSGQALERLDGKAFFGTLTESSRC